MIFQATCCRDHRSVDRRWNWSIGASRPDDAMATRALEIASTLLHGFT
jgi:hypothetical protein